MSRKQKLGGRHASIGEDRFIKAAARDAIAKLGGVRISFAKVIGKSSKSHPRGTWKRKKSSEDAMSGGISIILYGDPFAVEACVFLAANDNEPVK
jgi:hypothetical protein